MNTTPYAPTDFGYPFGAIETGERFAFVSAEIYARAILAPDGDLSREYGLSLYGPNGSGIWSGSPLLAFAPTDTDLLSGAAERSEVCEPLNAALRDLIMRYEILAARALAFTVETAPDQRPFCLLLAIDLRRSEPVSATVNLILGDDRDLYLYAWRDDSERGARTDFRWNWPEASPLTRAAEARWLEALTSLQDHFEAPLLDFAQTGRAELEAVLSRPDVRLPTRP